MNGVDTPTLLATIQAVGAQPELAKFQFRAKSEWIAGTHSRKFDVRLLWRRRRSKSTLRTTPPTVTIPPFCAARTPPLPGRMGAACAGVLPYRWDRQHRSRPRR